MRFWPSKPRCDWNFQAFAGLVRAKGHLLRREAVYKSLPKMAKAAQSDQLRAAFEKHYEETEGQIERLEQIFQMLGKPARGKKCDAASS